MPESISTWMKRQPVLAFYILALLISWLGWVPQTAQSHGLLQLDVPFLYPVLYVLGGAGPVVSAIIVMHVLRGEEAYKELFGQLLRWRVGAVWYVIALLGNAAVWLTAMAINGEFSAALQKFAPALALIPVFLTNLVKDLSEETGWRGFALPQLQSRYSALVSSLIIGVLSWVWHLPLLVMQGTIMATYPLFPYFLYTIALAVLYTWVYNSTRGSLLIVTILHAAGNTVGYFVAPEAAITLALAALAVVVCGPATLSRGGGERRQATARPPLSGV